jgi:hypothetical protein
MHTPDKRNIVRASVHNLLVVDGDVLAEMRKLQLRKQAEERLPLLGAEVGNLTSKVSCVNTSPIAELHQTNTIPFHSYCNLHSTYFPMQNRLKTRSSKSSV